MHLSVSKNNTLAPVHVNAEWLMGQVELPFLIHALPAHSIYLALQTKDLQEMLEVVEWIRGSQLQRILDFDIWEFNTSSETEDISHHAVMSWLNAWLMIGKEFTSARFFELEEETVTLVLSKLYHIIPDGIGYVADDIRENWTLTPDKKFFIKPVSEDGTDFEILTSFIDALYGTDMAYAGTLFTHASLLIRNETLEQAQKWRQARLADQGFLSKQEALDILFSSQNTPKPLSEYKYLSNTNVFIEDATENTFQFLSKLEPEDGVHLIRQILGTDRIKQLTGTQNQNVNFSHLYDDADFLNDCVEHIVDVSQTIYKQLEHTQIADSSKHETLLIEKIFEHFLEKDPHVLSVLKQKVARISNTVASALYDHRSYQKQTLNTALTIVRGCLNIGLQMCLNHPTTHNLQLNTQNDAINRGISTIESLGIDYVFKIGFNEIINLQKSLLDYLFERKLIQTKKIKTAKKWICSDTFLYSNEIRLALEGLCHLVPMLHPELFIQNNQTTPNQIPIHLSQQFKPFEHNTEVSFMQILIKNLDHNLN